MQNEPGTREYHPELLSRRGELTTWILGAAATVAWLILALGGYYVFPVLPVLAVLLVLAGMGISLGNWMDRHSLIRIDPMGIQYENGLRRTYFKWDEIVRVEVYAHRWGDKVLVLGENSRFDFRTLGEVKMRGETKGKMGFAAGGHILQTILSETGMKEIAHDEDGYYYARD